MIIFLWLICFAVFISAAIFLFSILLNNQNHRELWHTFINGFQTALRGSGLQVPKSKYPVELWVWETMDDEYVCDDCLERSSWPPMDIADWMKEGLPRTPECDTQCCENCRCRLVRYNPKKTHKPFHKY